MALERTVQAALMRIGSTVAFALMAALVKKLSYFHTSQVVFFRAFFTLVPLVLVLAYRKELFHLKSQRLAGHLVRSICGVCAMFLGFYAYRSLQLAEVYSITYSSSLFLTLLAVPLLKEKVGWHRLAAVGVGFSGVLVILQPGIGVFQWASILVLISAVLQAVAMITIRQLTQTERSDTIVFYFMLVTSCVSASILPSSWRTPTLLELTQFIGAGFLGGLGQMLIVGSTRRAEVTVLAVLDYLSLVWVVLLDFWVWGSLPGKHLWIGMVLIVFSGLFIIYRETMKGRWLRHVRSSRDVLE